MTDGGRTGKTSRLRIMEMGCTVRLDDSILYVVLVEANVGS